eukprot:CAMPEP_0113632868 /NCGR_PEP_ID=MMETSP0017_2-20120614/17093_1 /TAXON_ID=2856 /ORGANISM="Cylindrotheca closterium" /LENGTH=559 /DNA_ID=CAMNT_0000543459 /DNA_START=236 /DNA_END=1915 /DNA_ORIENTATION=- /assembly_acc=CAM_ASM_000147
MPSRNVPTLSTTELAGKTRKARRMQKVEKQNRLIDAIDDANGKETKKDKKKKKRSSGGPPDDDDDSTNDAQAQMEARPDLSTMIVDEETGFELIQQGKNVLDVVTRKAVKLSDRGPDYRLAQMFPGVPPEVREKHRVDWNTVEVPELVEKLRAACSVKLEDGTTGIPPRPSISNEGLDFVLANRDLLGRRMKKTLGRLTMRTAWLEDEKAAKDMDALWMNFLTLENHISAPFRQIIQDAEGRVGPNFGNLELKSYSDGDLYERIGNYIVLKGMVAHWEKKVVDADFIEKNPPVEGKRVSILARGDPKRDLPEPPILFTLKECTQVCAMAQQMCQIFVESDELFADFPPEVVFLEEALKVKGGAALRKYMIDDFCPKRGITPEALREGMRRFFQQLENMQKDPYADLTNKVESLFRAMAIGTDDQRNPYEPYLCNLDKNGPGYFQTYTFNHGKQSIVRFLDNKYENGKIEFIGQPEKEEESSNDGGFLGGLFDFGNENKSGPVKSLRSEPTGVENTLYTAPDVRGMGRPHELGWLEKIETPEEDWLRLGQVPAGRIITED